MSAQSPITTHILDTSRGRPAAGVAVVLYKRTNNGEFAEIGAGTTNDDGRVADLLSPGTLVSGTYRLRFDVGGYHAQQGVEGFYPEVVITFQVRDGDEHYHVPLLLNPFGYSTYRGS